MAELEGQPATTRVNVAAIIDGIHSRYGQQLANLVQENAETAAATEQLHTQLGEANSKVAVLDGMRQDAIQREAELEEIVQRQDAEIKDLKGRLQLVVDEVDPKALGNILGTESKAGPFDNLVPAGPDRFA